MKKFNNIYKVIGASAALLMLSCNNDLDQVPNNIPESSSLTEFGEVLNAAYFYQHASATPMAVMGDFRADNALMYEEPYPAFDRYNSDLSGGDLEDQFFAPIYKDLYNSILSVNNVIENSSDPVEVGEARFLRALSYFKLIIAFGDVSVNLDAFPSLETIDPTRQPAEDVYNNIVIPDLEAAIEGLDGSITYGRASRLAAQALLGKVYVYLNDFVNAETYLSAAISEAAAAGIVLESDFANVVSEDSSEIIYSIPITASVADNYGDSEFTTWFAGEDTKANFPVDIDLVNAFEAVAGEIIPTLQPNPDFDPDIAGSEEETLQDVDFRRGSTIGATVGDGETSQIAGTRAIKYSVIAEQDWVELRLSDVILLYAEVLNENGSAASEVLGLLDPIRSRASLNPLDPTAISSQAMVRQAIQDERRLELAFEGQRWFDLVRTGTVDAEMGQEINPFYHIFPVPSFEISATVVNGEPVVIQNPGY